MRLTEWVKSLDMTFHSAKCTRLLVTENKQVFYFDCKIHSQTLASVTSAKYPGITIHKEVSWDDHIKTHNSNGKQDTCVPQMQPQDQLNTTEGKGIPGLCKTRP